MKLPLTPAGCDLRDFPHTPLFRARLFGSSFHARSTDAEWRAGLTLWLKSWDQVPAGSLPNDDIELCRLAELARDVKTWKKVKDGALRGWLLCDDGRLYHPVVAEGVNNAIEKKNAQRAKTAKARIAALEKRLKECKTDADKAHVTEEIQKIKQSLSQTSVPSVTDAVTGSKREGREGEGEGEGSSSSEPNGSGGQPPADPPAAPTPPTSAAPPPPTPPPPPPPPAPAPSARDMVFALGVPLLTGAGVKESNARSFLAMRSKTHGDPVLVSALEACAAESPIQPVPWLEKRLGVKPAKHAGFASMDYREGVEADGSFN